MLFNVQQGCEDFSLPAQTAGKVPVWLFLFSSVFRAQVVSKVSVSVWKPDRPKPVEEDRLDLLVLGFYLYTAQWVEVCWYFYPRSRVAKFKRRHPAVLRSAGRFTAAHISSSGRKQTIDTVKMRNNLNEEYKINVCQTVLDLVLKRNPSVRQIILDLSPTWFPLCFQVFFWLGCYNST